MKFFGPDEIDEARDYHDSAGGFLYRLDNGLDENAFQVTSNPPWKCKAFESYEEAIKYAFALAEADYDETQMTE